MNITEYIIDNIAGTEKIRIGTWADDYYADLNDYYSNCGMFGSVYFYKMS